VGWPLRAWTDLPVELLIVFDDRNGPESARPRYFAANVPFGSSLRGMVCGAVVNRVMSGSPGEPPPSGHRRRLGNRPHVNAGDFKDRLPVSAPTVWPGTCHQGAMAAETRHVSEPIPNCAMCKGADKVRLELTLKGSKTVVNWYCGRCECSWAVKRHADGDLT
jgi:hypothetical protein